MFMAIIEATSIEKKRLSFKRDLWENLKILKHLIGFTIILALFTTLLMIITGLIKLIRHESIAFNPIAFFIKLDFLNLVNNLPGIIISSITFNIIPSSYKTNFLQNALLAGIVISIVSAVVGSFVLLRGLVFLGQAIAHSAFAGAAFAILLGELFLVANITHPFTDILSTPVFMISIFAVGSALGIGFVNEKNIMKNEVIVGIVFSFFMAMAVLFIGLLISYSTDINSILFGNLLLVSAKDFSIMLLFSTIIFTTIIIFKKELYFITFDPELAQLSGISVRPLSYLFLILVSLTISVTLQAIGAILVFAMVITPAAAAYQWTYRLNILLILSGIFGVFATTFGLYLSYFLDLPSSSTIVMLITLIFAYSFIFSPKRGISSGEDSCHYCGKYIKQKTNYCDDDNIISIPHKHIDDNILILKEDYHKTEKYQDDHRDNTEKGENQQ